MKRTHISFLIFIIIICFSSLFSNKAEAQKLSVNLLPAENKVYLQAQNEFDNGNYVKAKEYYSQLLSLYPRETYFNYYYGACLVNLNSEFYKSIDYLEYALRGEVYQANYYLGKTYHLNYMFSKALEYYEDFSKSASPKDLKNFPIDRQVKMAENGIYLIKFTYELKVLKNKKVNQGNFYYSYDIPHTGGEIVVIPEEFKSKIDKKLNYKGLMYVSKVFDIAFFSSYGNSKSNSLDIYMVKKENEKWGQPVLLPSAINTDEDEAYPFFHPSGEYLYFSSKGHNSMGGYDIFKVQYNRFTNSWGQAENLDFPINTPLDDIMYITDSRDISAYFASTRESDINKIGVYQILIEQNPLQRLVENMTDLLKTAKLETNSAAIIEYDRIIEEIRISETEFLVDSIFSPEDTERRRLDSILINEEYELITNISNQLDKLESNYQDFRLQYFAALSLIEKFVENVEQIEEKYKSVERSNLKNIEKETQLSKINDEIKEYADSIIAIKILAEAHENLIKDIGDKKFTYRVEADELFSKRNNEENNKDLKILNSKLNQSLEIVPESLKLKENNKLLAENETKTNKNNEKIINLNATISKIDDEVLQLYDSLSASEFIQIQTNLTQKINSLEYQRKTLVAEYKETYLQQQFLSTETQQVQKINDIAEQHIPLSVEGINEYSENSGRRILSKTNYYIQRRNQLNLEDMAKAQEKIIDSIFFDNTKLLTQKFESENKEISIKQNTNFKQIVIINEIINTQNFATHNIEKYATQAQNIIDEMALLDENLSTEADIHTRKNIIDKFNDKEEYLNQVFDKINAEIKEFTDNVFVEEIIPNSKQSLRDFAQSNIDSLREIGKETDIALAENYLNSADSLYALAAAISQDDTKISSAQDYYLKQALIFENKAIEIVAAEDSYAFASEIETEEKLIVEKQNAITEIFKETHQNIVNIQDENRLSKEESLNLAELTNSYYDNAEKLINEANSTSKQKKKAELFEQAANQWQEAENTHAQLAKNELNNSIEEFYVIDKAFENIEKINASNQEFEEVYIIKQKAEILHKEAGNLLIKAEETNEIAEKNKLIINAVEIEKQATEKYKNAYNLISDINLPETEYASNLIKTHDENKFEEIAQILEEKSKSSEEDKVEISTNLISEKYNTIIKSKLDRLDSLMVVNENTNNEILVLESNYKNTKSDIEKEQLIENITALQNERTINHNNANQIIFEIQNDKINYNSELIETIASLDKKNKNLLKEINKKYSKYSSTVEKLQYETAEHYFVMLAEVVILGNEIIENQNEIINKIETDLTDKLADIGKYQEKLNVVNTNILKTNEWLTEQEHIIAQAKIKESELKNTEDEIINEGVDIKEEDKEITENIYFSENENLISENTKKIQEIENNEFGRDLKFKQEKSDIKELEIKINSLKEDIKNSTYIEDTQELTNKFEKLEIELISKQEQYLTNVINLLAYSKNQQDLKNKAQKNKEAIAKFNSNNENINSAIYRAKIAENLLNQKADSIGNLLEAKYENLESNEIKKLQNEEIELRKSALSLSADVIEIITNNNENIAQEINTNYSFIEYTYKEKQEEFIAKATENKEIITDANKTTEIFIDTTEIEDSIIETTEPEKLIAKATENKEIKVHETEKTYTDSKNEGEIKINIEVEEEVEEKEIVYLPENELIENEKIIEVQDDYELKVINLPEIGIFANTGNMSKSEQKVYQKIIKDRNNSKFKIDKLNEQIRKLENKKQTARTENKISKLQDKRSNYITDYYLANSEIISIEAEQLVAKYSEISPLFIENKKHADSLLIIAKNNKKQAEILWNKALVERDNTEKSVLLYQADSLINEHLALHQKSIIIIESNESIKPLKIADDTNIDDLADAVQEDIKTGTIIEKEIVEEIIPANETKQQITAETIIENSEKGLIYRIQFAAYNRIVGEEYTKGLSPIYTENVSNSNLIRFMTGIFGTQQMAAQALPLVKNLGFTDAFIVAYIDGRRVSLKEANEWLAQNTPKEHNLLAIGETQIGVDYSKPIYEEIKTKSEDKTISREKDVIDTKGVFLTVQYAASKRVLSPAEFFNIQADFHEYLDNGYIRHMSGLYLSLTEANNERNQIRNVGARDAFVVAYKDGVRININDALKVISSQASTPKIIADITENQKVKDETKEQADKSKSVVYEIEIYVQIGAYRKEVSDEILNLFKDIANENQIKIVRNNNLLIYRIGPILNKNEAQEIRERAVNRGISDAFILAFKDGKQISLQSLNE